MEIKSRKWDEKVRGWRGASGSIKRQKKRGVKRRTGGSEGGDKGVMRRGMKWRREEVKWRNLRMRSRPEPRLQPPLQRWIWRGWRRRTAGMEEEENHGEIIIFVLFTSFPKLERQWRTAMIKDMICFNKQWIIFNNFSCKNLKQSLAADS